MISLHHISKFFSGVHALNDVSMEFRVGEIHALCGENGAGKSTLMNIISGNIAPDEGEIYMEGKAVYIRDVRHAQELGISIVYQEGSLSEALDVAENIYPNRQPLTSFGTIDRKKLNDDARRLLEELNIHDVHPGTSVSRLNAEQKKMVEIAKALSLKPSFLILDEPTAPVSSDKTDHLFAMLRSLKKKGVTIVYISHRMDEIMKIADRISVLKDGVYQGTLEAKDVTIDQVIRMMIGRDILQARPVTAKSAEVMFGAMNLSGSGFEDVSFELRKGEIFGLAGLQGSGRTSVARTIFGDLPVKRGRMIKDQRVYRPLEPADAIDNKVVYIPEDRKTVGLFLEKSLEENIASAHLQRGLYRQHYFKALSAKYIHDVRIKTGGATTSVKKLSGGNQQKVVLAKWLSKDPDLLIINEPTHGVDVGAKSEIYRILHELAAQGKSILLISSDLPELLLLSHRIGVMHVGRLKKIFERDDATEEMITATASGIELQKMMDDRK